jgi:large subunit ribosomal protein L22
MYAKLKNYRQAPRKVRSVTDLVKGKTVEAALTELTFVPKKASLPIKKLIASAFANANQKGAGIAPSALVVKEITVNKGMTFRRFMPRARGRASAINKESSHVEVTLAPKAEKPGRGSHLRDAAAEGRN